MASDLLAQALDRMIPNRSQGRLFVISGPSGSGKDTLIDALLKRLPDDIGRSISATTRLPRSGEIDGKDYFFLTPEQFAAEIAGGRFLEYERYGEYLYGTPLASLKERRELGVDVILKIEVKGAQNVRQLIPEAILIFIAPPSLQELEARLRARKTETEQAIIVRLHIAKQEMEQIPLYDYVVTNDGFDTALDALRCIVIAERHRIRP